MIASIFVDPFITQGTRWNLVRLMVESVSGPSIVPMDGKRLVRGCCWGLLRLYHK
jgi:hypothetical protein